VLSRRNGRNGTKSSQRAPPARATLASLLLGSAWISCARGFVATFPASGCVPVGHAYTVSCEAALAAVGICIPIAVGSFRQALRLG
jgi:hypothetical protein